MDRRGIPGWDKVCRLATELLADTGLSLSRPRADSIRELWDQLERVDREDLIRTSRAPPADAELGSSRAGRYRPKRVIEK